MSKELYNWYKEHGICARCGGADAVKGKTRCVTCADKEAELHRRYWERQKKDKDRAKKKAEYFRAYQKERYKRLKEAGLCVDCGKPQTKASTVYCLECYVKYNRRREARKNDIARNERKAYGMCYVCAEPVGKCGTMCDKCYEMVCANLPKKMHQSLYMLRKQQNKALFGG